jgi:putative oxidoreductase
MIPERYAPMTYALFRIVFGFLFLCNGLLKTFGLFGGTVMSVTSLPGAAGWIETIGGILIMIGLGTRVVAFLTSGEMAIAYFLIHQPQATWPIQNMGQPAVLFCFAFLYMASRGSGIWSVDAMMGRRP